MTHRIMNKVLGLAAGLLALAAMPAAHAHVNWAVGVNLPGVNVGMAAPQRVVYVQPGSRYVQSAPAYVPQQVMTYPPAVMPPVVYQQPVYPGQGYSNQVYAQPVYPPVVYAPAPAYRPWGHGGWHHNHEQGHGYGREHGYGGGYR
jgi:hypothetical protein